MTQGDYELKRLQKETAKRLFKEQLFHDFIDRYFRGKAQDQINAERKFHEKRKNTKKTVRDNITKKSLDMFCTVTLQDRDKAQKENLKLVQYSFKDACDKMGIEYCMLPELHEDEVSVHLHGFIRVDDKNLLQAKIYGQDIIKNGKITKKKGSPVFKRGKPVYTIPHFERYFGFTTLQYLTDDPVEVHKQVNYMLKYATKSSKEIEFKLMSSRKKKPKPNQRVIDLLLQSAKYED